MNKENVVKPNDTRPSIIKEREQYSRDRMNLLKQEISGVRDALNYPDLTIIGAGSYARLEASEYSDIDMFFFYSGDRDGVEEPRTREIKLFGSMIEVISELGFPKFSKDCQYLEILPIKNVIDNLGSPIDDHKNYFTARMLLLLESKCLFGDTVYDKIIDDILDFYYKDFPGHEENFKPTFLLNDICRYWKTILLNYENKRDINSAQDREKVIKRKVHNFKLKFSRMTTCFATICAIGSLDEPVSREQIVQLINMTPRERLEEIPSRIEEAQPIVDKLLKQYSWFLEMTGLPEAELNSKFDESEKRREMFETANKYGDSMFELLMLINSKDSSNGSFIRHLVI